MFKLFYNRKKGFTVVELIVALAITGLVLGAFGAVFYSLHYNYNRSITRSRIINAVQLASQKFETSAGLIANSKQVDVLYDPVIAGGIYYNANDDTFKWRGAVKADAISGAPLYNDKGEPELDTSVTKPYVIHKEGESNATDPYTYIFSTPAYAEDGDGNASNDKFLGYYLFIRNDYDDYVEDAAGNKIYPSMTNSKRFLDDEGAGDAPVRLEIGIATNELPENNTWPESANDEDTTTATSDEETTETDLINTTKYTNNCIKIVFKSGNEALTQYEVETTYSLINFTGGKKINYSMENNTMLIMKAATEEDIGWGAGKAYPCGWNDETLGTSTAAGFPNAQADGTYATVVSTVSLTQAQLKQSGNVLRFLSPLNDHSAENAIGKGGNIDQGTCPLEDFLINYQIDTSISEPILTGLRSFRDNVLSGTAFGDWFIDFYYHSFTPFYYENKGRIEPVFDIIFLPVSWIYSTFIE